VETALYSTNNKIAPEIPYLAKNFHIKMEDLNFIYKTRSIGPCFEKCHPNRIHKGEETIKSLVLADYDYGLVTHFLNFIFLNSLKEIYTEATIQVVPGECTDISQVFQN
jgi:hypothetical protein